MRGCGGLGVGVGGGAVLVVGLDYQHPIAAGSANETLYAPISFSFDKMLLTNLVVCHQNSGLVLR